MYGLLTISILYLLPYPGASYRQRCTEENFMRCWGTMDEFNDEMHSSLVPILDDVRLTQHCHTYEDSMDCFDYFVHLCHPIDRHILRGIDDAYDWLCEEGRQEYTMYRQCLNNDNMQDEGLYCNDTLHERIAAITQEENFFYKHQRICQYANDYLDCVQNAVTSFCDSRPGSWVRELETRLIEPLLRSALCVLHEDGEVYYGGGSSEESNHHDNGHSITMGTLQRLLLLPTLILIGMVSSAMLVALAIRKHKAAKVATASRRRHILPPPIGNNPVFGITQNSTQTSITGLTVFATPVSPSLQPLPDKTGFTSDTAPPFTQPHQTGFSAGITRLDPLPAYNETGFYEPTSPPPNYRLN